jgi:DNA-binding NtrC family response regulator
MASPDTVDMIRASARDLKTLLEDYERDLIQTALAEAGGHQRRAAASLGLLPTTLCENIKRLGLRQGTHATAAD